MGSETGDPSSKSGRFFFLSLRVNAIEKVMNPSSASYKLTIKTYEALLPWVTTNLREENYAGNHPE